MYNHVQVGVSELVYLGIANVYVYIYMYCIMKKKAKQVWEILINDKIERETAVFC